jgi:hypothetical protein
VASATRARRLAVGGLGASRRAPRASPDSGAAAGHARGGGAAGRRRAARLTDGGGGARERRQWRWLGGLGTARLGAEELRAAGSGLAWCRAEVAWWRRGGPWLCRVAGRLWSGRQFERPKRPRRRLHGGVGWKTADRWGPKKINFHLFPKSFL